MEAVWWLLVVVVVEGGAQWDTWSQGGCPKCSLQGLSLGREVEAEFQVLWTEKGTGCRRTASLEAGMGPPQGECKSSALAGRGQETGDRWGRKKEVPPGAG